MAFKPHYEKSSNSWIWLSSKSWLATVPRSNGVLGVRNAGNGYALPLRCCPYNYWLWG